jgi:hypothetical protein
MQDGTRAAHLGSGIFQVPFCLGRQASKASKASACHVEPVNPDVSSIPLDLRAFTRIYAVFTRIRARTSAIFMQLDPRGCLPASGARDPLVKLQVELPATSRGKGE